LLYVEELAATRGRVDKGEYVQLNGGRKNEERGVNAEEYVAGAAVELPLFEMDHQNLFLNKKLIIIKSIANIVYKNKCVSDLR
jgi:hypothetical protein